MTDYNTKMKLKLRHTIDSNSHWESVGFLGRTHSTGMMDSDMNAVRTTASLKRRLPFIDVPKPTDKHYVTYTRPSHNEMVETAHFNFGLNHRTTYSVGFSEAVGCGAIQKQKERNQMYTLSAASSPQKVTSDKNFKKKIGHKKSHSVCSVQGLVCCFLSK